MLYRTDPLERLVEEALTKRGIPFAFGEVNGLDFHIPGPDIFIEVKALHTDRVSDQMARAPDRLIVLQGRRAVEFFCAIINGDET